MAESKVQSFNHLKIHSQYSICEGAIKIDDLKEISKEKNYLQIDRENKKIVTLILGGPNKYYAFSEKEIDFLFNKIKNIFTRDKYKLIIIPSYRTPSEIIKKAFN